MNRLVLIDGNAILHRAYHALPPLTSPDGKQVNAVYGFVSILLKLYHELQPTYIAVAFDRPKPTFRKELYKEYQAKRPEMEEGLSSQIGIVHEVVASFNIPVFEFDGYEADDVLGSLVKQAVVERRTQNSMTNQKPDEIVIVTGDRDLLQLVDDEKGVKVFMPVKGISEGKLFGEFDAKERVGVEPKKIPDYKALAGDQSDNYPGVPGIGPKMAAELIERFGSVEEVYQQIESKVESRKSKVNNLLSERVVEKLKAGKESALLSKNLATIRTDVPVDIQTIIPITTLDTFEVRAKLSDLHFPSLIKRLDNSEKQGMVKKKTDDIVTTEETKEKEHVEQQQLF